MFRIINGSNRMIAQRVVRSSLTFTRAESRTDAEAGSVASGNDAFSKKEHAEEARWARRNDAEQIAKYKAEHAKLPPEQRLANLEADKKHLEQEIADLKRQLKK